MCVRAFTKSFIFMHNQLRARKFYYFSCFIKILHHFLHKDMDTILSFILKFLA